MPNKFRLVERGENFWGWGCRSSSATATPPSVPIQGRTLINSPYTFAPQNVATVTWRPPLLHVALIYCGWIRSQQITSHELRRGGEGLAGPRWLGGTERDRDTWNEREGAGSSSSRGNDGNRTIAIVLETQTKRQFWSSTEEAASWERLALKLTKYKIFY